MKLRTLTQLLIISIFTQIYSGCKSILPSKINNVEDSEIIHKRLGYLIKKDSIDSFYTFFNENNYNPNYIDKLGTTLLFYAVAYNNIEICDFLLKKGADINFVSEYGTVMHWALEKGYKVELANFLLDKGYNAKVEEKIKRNPEPLNFKCTFIIKKNKIEGMKLFKRLLDNGMNPNLQDREGFSAIHLAAYFEYIDLIRLLCQEGANLNLVSKGNNSNSKKDTIVSNSYTPLMFATYFERQQSVSELLKCENVKINMKSKDGKTALDIAKENKNKFLIELITSANKSYKK